MENKSYTHSELSSHWKHMFLHYCEQDNVVKIKELLNSSDTSQYFTEKGCLDKGFHQACDFNGVDTVKYLLSINKINLPLGGIVNACTKGHIEVLKLIMEIPEFEKEIYFGKSQAFIAAYKNNHMDVVGYLFDKVGFKLNEETKNFILKDLGSEHLDYLSKVQESRELFNKIDKNLKPLKITSLSKLKI